MISIDINIEEKTVEDEILVAKHLLRGAVPANIYAEVEALKEEMSEAFNRISELENAQHDSGWLDLPLSEGITPYSEDQKPRYRKIGKDVFLSGVYRGATDKDIVIATLPEGFRPSKRVIFAEASVGIMLSKISIHTDGKIYLNRTTVEPVVDVNWHSIACNFSTD